ncbi:hypothetical protein FOZ62_030224 [Perkinsus olseni]|uniref:Uncharacterized protein n=1 Tax=Perkinsus olseni TaxID=32597 RepID=A0A7J6QQ65_PEROL|nr:hypothetical protein FOZ62_030224 [Perkinsus olseni]
MSSTKVEHKPAAVPEAAVVSKEGEHHSHSRGHHKKIGAANPTFKKLFNDGRPATLSDEDTLSYDTLKVYGPGSGGEGCCTGPSHADNPSPVMG